MAQSILDDEGSSNPATNAHLLQVAARAEQIDPARRRVLRVGLGAATLPFLGALGGCATGLAAAPERMLGFKAVAASSGDSVLVPDGYAASVLIPWGEPIRTGAPAWRADASNSAADQEQQIGDNHDGMWFFPFNAAGNGPGERRDEGLLVVNHEYTNIEYLYAPGSDPNDWLAPFTREKARKAQAAHGVSVVHLRRAADGSWVHVKDSPYNRRIHGNTPCVIQGPAAGLPLLRTQADPAGIEVLGTLNNCGANPTPWGTYLTCEENFNGYFGWNGSHTPDRLARRYGVTQNGFGYRWHTVDARFDVAANPNEPNRFGWVVEIDPFDPNSKAVKRTALGRFKHENAAVAIAPNGKVVVYMGDDERNEYIYKFVSDGVFDRANPFSAANLRLLERGTLYVARSEPGAQPGDGMGTGRWVPLRPDTIDVNGRPLREHPELAAASDEEVLGMIMVKTRIAADAVGATMMDRPEWIAVHPNQPGQVYATLTNNNRRGTEPASTNQSDGGTASGSARPPVDEVNPRPNNVWGHIVRWTEKDKDPSATEFTWDLFVLAGQPGVAAPRAASANIHADNLFNSPDGLAFDPFGRLWIQTDGNFSNKGEFAGMGNNQMLAADPQTGEIRRFLVGPSGCEITGITWTPDRRTMFVCVQHPGELGDHPRAPRNPDGKVWSDNQIARAPTAFSQWPRQGERPRSAVVVIRRVDGGVIGG